MQAEEYRQFWHHPQLDVGLLQAYHVEYAYPRHSHDHYVICVIDWGVQSFTLKGTKYVTPPSGLILINPGVVHTGEAATEHGFRMRSLYPTTVHMERAVYELTGQHQAVPFFRDVRIDDAEMARKLSWLHQTLTCGESELESESCFLSTLTQLIQRHGEIRINERPLGHEHDAVRQVRHYIEANFAERISLQELARQVSLSPYYLLRVFQAEVGMPPYAYLQDVRIRRAQRLIELGKPLAEVAFAVGFSSQSHLTRRFKQIVGTTPGRYALQVGPPSLG